MRNQAPFTPAPPRRTIAAAVPEGARRLVSPVASRAAVDTGPYLTIMRDEAE